VFIACQSINVWNTKGHVQAILQDFCNPAIERLQPRMSAMNEAEKKRDAELLNQVAQGDERAFALLYDRFAGPLFSLVRQMTNDETEAQDALSEGFTQIWRRASSYDEERSAAFTWAVMLVRNKTIDRMRVRQRVAKVRESVAGAILPEDDVDAESMLAPHLRERAQLVRQVVNTLPEDQRTPLEMNFFDGMTHDEIAERLETPLGTVKARIRRGLQKLRSVWKEDV
jgi:RNA polymerase sigma-70 factor, ECF subfamily